MPESLRVLVVDDEPLARQRVLDLLDRSAAVEVVGTAGTGRKRAPGALQKPARCALSHSNHLKYR